MDDYYKELKKVKDELGEVDSLLEDLLVRQSLLLERKNSLERIIKEHNNSCTSDTVNDWTKEDFKWSGELKKTLTDVFELDELRPMQLQTMNVTMSKKDCMLIMPTGGGKSLCFQLPAVISKGITLVVSPLISLMEDQLMALAALDIDSTTFNSTTSTADAKQIQTAMTDHKSTLKLLYVTPEKLAKSKRFMNKLEKMYEMGRFARLVIDEVHCCSQWGHDFRPEATEAEVMSEVDAEASEGSVSVGMSNARSSLSITTRVRELPEDKLVESDYKFLGIMKRQFPEVPILGLTATATVIVLDDVKKILNVQNCHLLRASFNRPNLYYEVRNKPSSQAQTMEEITKLIKSRFSNQSGIVYCFSRKDAEEVTIELQKNGIKSGCYHANLTGNERSSVHKLWSHGKILVVVATIAFGMGIDKPDVRFVIHHSISKSMENLYQESGRAGRDSKTSYCILFYRLGDVFRQSCMVFTEQTGLKCLYGILAYCLDTKRCRRSMIAEHFGEAWQASHCNGMCDHCDTTSKYTSTEVDITNHCKNILTVLQHSLDTDQRVTALKLIDAWFGKGVASLKVKEVKEKNISTEKAEKIIGYMLLNGYLKEDFHFTAYSTISYIKPGPKSKLLLGNHSRITLDIQVKAINVTNNSKSPSQVATSSGKKTSSSGKNTPTLKEKPKLVVINRENSQLSSFTADVTNSGDTKLKRDNSKVKKRRQILHDTDDSDALDFGDTNNTKKRKSLEHSGRNSDHINNQDSVTMETDLSVVNGSTSHNSAPICIIDSDSDFET